VVPYAKGEEGVKVAVVPLSDRVPATGPTPVSRKLAVVTLPGATASENVAVTAAPMGTFVAPASGDVPVTVGGVRSGAAPVVKDQEVSDAIAFPARSCTPVVT